MWLADNDIAIVGNRTDEVASVQKLPSTVQEKSVWFDEKFQVAVRTTDQGDVLYMAAGHSTPHFLELFKKTPCFAYSSNPSCDARLQRREHRELAKALIAFVTLDGLEDFRRFLQMYKFPLEIVEQPMDEDAG